METINTTINLYSFKELNDESKQIAIEKHRDFLLTVTRVEDYDFEEDYNSEMDGLTFNDSPVIESIEMNDYLFFSDGELADCTTYTGKHEKSGITELKLLGNTYIV